MISSLVVAAIPDSTTTIGADLGSFAVGAMTSQLRVRLPTFIEYVVVVDWRSTALMMCAPANVATPSVVMNAVSRTRKRPIIVTRVARRQRSPPLSGTSTRARSASG